MKTKKIFEGVKGIAKIAYVEDVTNRVVLSENCTEKELKKIKKWLKKNGYKDFEIENPLPPETTGKV